MAIAVPLQAVLSVAEYLSLEQDSSERHEFIDGQLFAMAGASERHSIIKMNLLGRLLVARPADCRVFDGDMKLLVQSGTETRYYYPDVFVSCSPGDQGQHARCDAVLITEILSPSTERIDRFEKCAAYSSMPTLLECVLIAQDTPRVEIRRRRADWVSEGFGLGTTITVESITLTLPTDAIYADIDYLKSLQPPHNPTN